MKVSLAEHMRKHLELMRREEALLPVLRSHVVDNRLAPPLIIYNHLDPNHAGPINARESLINAVAGWRWL